MKSKIWLLFLAVLMMPVAASAQEERKKDEGGAYFVVDEMPEFPGGNETLRSFLLENVNYPEEAKKDSITGKVFVSFVVDEAGKVIQIKIEKGVDPLLDQEALRVVGLMPTWKPGKENGEVVKVRFNLPVNFALD
ncbi:energy transducer TonB [Gaoshiqia sediminis]|uniref:Energy transducer TonB n=1 Tax=Gaoshiqia sediminis TaxID=2986998 RepID=A0AA42C965_9BACT|nr:energy transducer TonB [Gaoshiqia sediminis]MCW0483541.1 energy transducer TonB [Gaoshiqia sediminis]